MAISHPTSSLPLGGAASRAAALDNMRSIVLSGLDDDGVMLDDKLLHRYLVQHRYDADSAAASLTEMLVHKRRSSRDEIVDGLKRRRSSSLTRAIKEVTICMNTFRRTIR